MTKKTQAERTSAKALSRFAAVAAVLLTLCLVFMMPAAADDTYTGGIVLPEYITADSFEPGMTVYDGTTYYATLTAALTGIHGTDNDVLYCKPDEDVGQMTHGHVCKSLTVYGNGAHISGGERDFEIDHLYPSGISCTGLTGDITLKVYNLTGAGAWGSRNSEYIINLEFVDCDDIEKIFFNPSIKGTLDITLTDCTFIGDGNVDMDNDQCGVYSNANGEITLTRVIFSNVDKAVNLNHKVAGTQTITITDCTFTNCGSNVDDDEIPVRVLSSVEGGTSVLTVSGCSFSGTPKGGADILLDYGVGTTATYISRTAANIFVETANSGGTIQSLTASDIFMQNIVAEIGDAKYHSLQDAINNAEEDETVILLSDIEISNGKEGTIKVDTGKKLTLDLNGHTIAQKIVDPGLSVAAFAIREGATLTVTDNSADANGKISALKTAVQLTGTLNLEGGTIACDGPLTEADKTHVVEGEEYGNFAYSIWVYIPEASTTATPTFRMTGGSLFLGSEQSKLLTPASISIDKAWGTHEKPGPITISISGGLVNAGFKLADNVDISISGGTYSEEVTEYVADGYVCIKEDDEYVVEVISSEISKDVEKFGFDSVKVGYTQPEAQEVIITNGGNVPVTLTAATTSGKYDVTVTPATIGLEGTAKVTIKPNAGLPVGNYADTLTITVEGTDKSLSIPVSFLVYQPSSGGSSTTKPEEPVEPETPVEPENPTEEPEAGEPSVETEVTDGGEVLFEAPVEPETPGADTPSDEPAEPAITGVVLPAGTDSEVAFIPVSEKPAPAGKETQTKKVFEINVPKYEKGKPATVKFTMTVAELAADGKTAADVALWHQDEETGEWTKLVTTFVIIDGVVYFEAITFDFSPFAIVYEDVSAPTEPETPEQPTESPAPILAVLAGLGAAVVLRRK